MYQETRDWFFSSTTFEGRAMRHSTDSLPSAANKVLKGLSWFQQKAVVATDR